MPNEIRVGAGGGGPGGGGGAGGGARGGGGGLEFNKPHPNTNKEKILIRKKLG